MATIGLLPNEILIYVFSQQNDKDLVEIVAKVCKRWRQVVHLDSLWREAFEFRWGSVPITPCFFKAAPSTSASSLLMEINYKREGFVVFWRQEYLLRQQLELVWKYGALQAVSFDTRVGGAVIDILDFSSPGNGLFGGHSSLQRSHNRISWSPASSSIPRLVAGSVATGIVVNCNSKTGKIDHSVLKICPAGEEEGDLTDTVTCISTSSTGPNTSWVLGSKIDGSIMACYQSTSSSATLVHSSSLSSAKIWFPRHVHSERVYLLSPLLNCPSFAEVNEKLFHYVDSAKEKQGALHYLFKSNHLFFLSAGADGRAAIYSTLFPSKCLIVFTGNQDAISFINVFDNVCVAGTYSGRILVWKVPIKQLLAKFQDHESFESVTEAVATVLSASATNVQHRFVRIFRDEISQVFLALCGNGHVYSFSVTEDCDKSSPLIMLKHHEHEPLAGPITQIAFQSSTKPEGPGLVATGHNTGCVMLWRVFSNCTFELVSVLRDQKNPISCIYLSAYLLITGCDDGSVYIYDTVGFKLLRGLNNKHRNQTVLQDRFRVTHIVNYGFVLCISQSLSVTSWSLRPKQEKTSRKPAIAATKVPLSYPKALQNPSNSHTRKEVQDDITETLTSLESRRKSLAKEKQLVKSVNGSLEAHDMSEQELLEYAKVLSVHEHSTGDPGSSSTTAAADFGDMTEAEEIELALALSLSEN